MLWTLFERCIAMPLCIALAIIIACNAYAPALNTPSVRLPSMDTIDRSERVYDMIRSPEQSALYDLESQCELKRGLLRAVMLVESAGDAEAVSSKGAIGLFQFMPGTAKQYRINPRDPDQSADGAARYFCHLKKRYNDDLPSMLAAYNWGPANVDKYGWRKAPKVTKRYIRDVLEEMG